MKLAKWLVGESDKFHGAVSLVHGDFHNRNLHLQKVEPLSSTGR